MRRFLYTTLVVVLSFLIGLLMIVILGGYMSEGEAAMGVGILWYYSLPAFLIIGILVSLATHRWYIRQVTVVKQVSGLFVFSLLVAMAAPTLTFAALWVRTLL
jgi:hypothetical protein